MLLQSTAALLLALSKEEQGGELPLQLTVNAWLATVSIVDG